VSAADQTVAAPSPAQRRVGRLERAAIAGVISREWTVFRHYWLSTTFSSIVQPTIYLLAFGFGFGALVSHVQGVPYVEFVGTGTVATAVLFSSVFPGMFTTFIRRKFQRTYDALLAAPVDVEELVTGEIIAISLKAGIYGAAPLLVAIAFGLNPAWGMLLVPPIGIVTGFGFAAFGVTLAGRLDSIDGFSYVNSAVITPLFLVAGTFFPISELPHWARIAANFNPLYHCVQLVRHASAGFDALPDLGHVGALLLFALIMWRLAIRSMTKRLID
jgi:lipooligosaccharide transport system permease protein